MSEKATICSKCKKLVPMSRIRADSNAKDWVCLDCYKLLGGKSSTKLRIREYDPLEKKKKELESNIKPIKGLKTSVKCNRCSYTFSVQENQIPNKCPYCAKEGTIRQQITSSDILREVEQEDRFMRKDRLI